jgi:hypothetical protein
VSGSHKEPILIHLGHSFLQSKRLTIQTTTTTPLCHQEGREQTRKE